MSLPCTSRSRTATDRMSDGRGASIRGSRPGAQRAGLGRAIGLGLAVVFACPAVHADTLPALPAGIVGDIDFGKESASTQVRHVANWALSSGDNHRLPYLIVDKVNARVFVFDASGRMQGVAAALLGMAKGDRSVDGIGNRPMSAIRPEDRITPAGRFVVSLDHDSHGKEVLVIDYAASISLHPVVKGTPLERRAQRLQSATSADNRISFGCINVPARFYATVVSPAFTRSNGVAYILPETVQASEIPGFYDPGREKPGPTLP